MASSIIRCKNTIQGLYFLHNLHHLHLFSTKSPNQSYSNYLVNNLGFSPQQALSTSTKVHYKYADYSKFSNSANSVVHFFKQHAFDDTHLKKVISSYPQILASNVEKTLIPKFKLLQDHGFSGSDLVSLISSNPVFVTKHMDHIIHDLRAILGSNDNLIKFFRKTQSYMGATFLVNIKSNIALLNNEYGFDIQLIRNSILRHPTSYLRNSQFFRDVLVRVEEELGIPRDSGVFFYGVRLLSTSSKKTIDSKCELFKSFGWTEYEVSELMRRNPASFLKSEENIRKKFGFLMTELGYKPGFLVTRSVLLSLSLEKRMAPRHRVLLVLKEKGLLLNYNFYTAALQTEPQFVKTLIEPFKEDVPGLLELYQKSKGCCNVDGGDNKPR